VLRERYKERECLFMAMFCIYDLLVRERVQVSVHLYKRGGVRGGERGGTGESRERERDREEECER